MPTRGIVVQALSLLVAIVFFGLLVAVVSMSLRQPGTPPPRTLQLIPNPLSLENYQRIFEIVPLAQFTLNSLLVVGMAVPVTIVVASFTGFAMAQLDPWKRGLLVTLAVFLMLVPVTALWLTRYLVVTQLGLADSLLALVLPALMGTSPVFVLLYYWSFRRFPLELYESARLDGAGVLMIWARIAMPLVRPATAAVAVLTFVTYWGDFISPLLYLKTESRYTLPMGLSMLQTMDKTNWSLLMAAAVYMVAPSVLLFLLVQRAFWIDDRISAHLNPPDG